MAVLNQSQFSSHCGVTRAAVSKAVGDGRVVLRSDKLIDTTDPVNVRYKLDQEQRKKGSAPALPPARKTRPKPDLVEVPEGPPSLDEDLDSDDQDEDGFEGDGILVAEKRALIRNRNANTARQMVALAKEMKLLIPRDIVERHDAKVGEEIRRFITSARTINQRMRAKFNSGATEKETEAFLEDELTGIADDVKRMLEEDL